LANNILNLKIHEKDSLYTKDPFRDAPPGTPPGEDESYLGDIYRWEVCCLDVESAELLWKKTAFEGSPRTKKYRATNYASERNGTDLLHRFLNFHTLKLFVYNTLF